MGRVPSIYALGFVCRGSVTSVTNLVISRLKNCAFHGYARFAKVWSGSQDGRGRWPRRSALAAASSLDAIARRTRPRAVRVRHRRRRQHIRRPSLPLHAAYCPSAGKIILAALSIGPLPGAKPSTMSREAAAQPSAAPPPSLFRSMFARCAGEEQEQQAADAADALSIGPQPALLHGTRHPLAAGQLGHFRNVLMQSARPPIPSRRPTLPKKRSNSLPNYMRVPIVWQTISQTE